MDTFKMYVGLQAAMLGMKNRGLSPVEQVAYEMLAEMAEDLHRTHGYKVEVVDVWQLRGIYYDTEKEIDYESAIQKDQWIATRVANLISATEVLEQKKKLRDDLEAVDVSDAPESVDSVAEWEEYSQKAAAYKRKMESIRREVDDAAKMVVNLKQSLANILPPVWYRLPSLKKKVRSVRRTGSTVHYLDVQDLKE